MGFKCVVPNCSSGYESEKKKLKSYAMFLAPRDPERRRQWNKIIPREFELTDCHRVCERHFTEDCIVRTKIIRYNIPGIADEEVRLHKPHLTDTAIPTIFPNCPAYLSKNIQTRKLPFERKPFIKIKKIKSEVVDQQSSSICPDGDLDVVQVIETVVVENETVLENNAINLSIEELFEHNFNNLPDSWGYHKLFIDGDRLLIFSKMIIIPNNKLPVIQKQIWLDQSMTYSCSIFSKLVNLVDCSVNKITSLLDLKVVLSFVNNLSVCLGSHRTDVVSDIAGFIDVNGRWRSNSCPYILKAGQTVCSYCTLLSARINSKIWRNKKNPLDHTKRVRMHLTDSNKIKHTILKKKLTSQRNKNTRANKRIIMLKNNIVTMEKDFYNMKENVVNEKIKSLDISPSQRTVISEILAASKVAHPKGNRYTEEWILLCLLINMRSPSVYTFLRTNEILPLPCIRTIRKYLSLASQKCGFDEQFFSLLKTKISKKEDFQKDGIILLDEISLREAVRVKTNTMTYTGLIDFGEDGPQASSLNEKANTALVFMFRPFADSYVQPVAVFVGQGPTKGALLAKLILKAVIFLEQAGLKIHAVVSDGAMTNKRMWTELGVTGVLGKACNYIQHPLDENRKIYALSDVPHLIKCVRNRLESKNLKTHQSESDIRWDHFRILYERDILNAGKFRVCPKIYAGHIYLTSMSKMRVKLATQIFSNSVAAGLQFYKERKVEGLENCEATIEFCLRMNNMFDALNRKFPKEGIRIDGKDLEYLKNSLEWLNQWELEKLDGKIRNDQFLTNTTAESLRVTLMSIIDLSEHLLNNCNYKYVLTGKMNQDPLERFFGTIRQAGGANDHPCTPTFLQLYNILSLNSILKPPKYGNCIIDTQDKPLQITLTEIKEIYADKNPINFKQNLKDKLDNLIEEGKWECEDVIQLDHSYFLADAADCVNYYVTGYLCKQLRKHTKCENCLAAFCNPNFEAVNSYSSLANIKSLGRLTHPNSHFFGMIQIIESTLLKYIEKIDVYEEVVTDLLQNVKFTFPCVLHKADILSYTIHYYITMRLRQYTHHINSESRKIAAEKKKTSKFAKT